MQCCSWSTNGVNTHCFGLANFKLVKTPPQATVHQ
jgi:hypothetical protein